MSTHDISTSVESNTADTLRGPLRIGVLVSDLKGLNLPALKYLVLLLNSLQPAFEFEFLPVDKEDALIRQVNGIDALDRKQFKKELPQFLERESEFLKDDSRPYNLTLQGMPRNFILITLARFTNNFYSATVPHLRVLALGNWDKHMAPPSILEATLGLVLRHSVALLVPEMAGNMHFGTKGCLFDFTRDLSEAKLKILEGFICSECRGLLAQAGCGSLADQLVVVLNTSNWLGRSADPGTPASVVAKLGYDLYLTRGIKPTFQEQVLGILRDEGTKEIIHMIGVVLQALLFVLLSIWLGFELKKP